MAEGKGDPRDRTYPSEQAAARKRPRLLPIIDSVVSGALGLGNAGSWAALQTALDDAQIRSAIDGMAPTLDGAAPTTLRLLDVATWMRFSESDNARDVRRSLGLPVEPRKALLKEGP